MTSECNKCDEPFEHPPGRFTVCPACKLAVARAAKKRWKKEQGSLAEDLDENWLKKLCVKSAAEVGKVFGLSRDQVLLIERKAIRKLREQKEVLKTALEEASEISELPAPPPDLIEVQMAVGEWWSVADHFSDMGKYSERRECVAQIEKFQGKIAEYLTGFHVGTLGGGLRT